MKLTDIMHKDAILTDLMARDKKTVIQEMAVPTAKILKVDLSDIIKVLLERERLGSTGIGRGIAIPHGKLKSIEFPILGLGISRKGVEFESIDSLPAHLFFVLITPELATGTHLTVLSQIARFLKNDDFKNNLLNAGSSQDILSIIQAEEDKP
ncbi:MAG: PTS sugar transporter subunit IIA [Desulfatirhabdiaceae bacterium]|jgi:PTS system nitrogen regulatory IIA component